MGSCGAAPETAAWPQLRQSSVAAGRRPQPFVCGVCSRQRRAESTLADGFTRLFSFGGCPKTSLPEKINRKMSQRS